MKKCTHTELNNLIKSYYDKKLALFIYGAFGIGKSFVVRDTARELATDRGREFVEWNRLSKEKKQEVYEYPKKYFVLIDERLSESDPTDIKGLPSLLNGEDVISWKIPFWAKFISLENSDGIIFFDEINLASPIVISSVYKIIYDRIINDVPINDNWLIVGAGNRAEDLAFTHTLPAPVRDRGGECMPKGTLIVGDNFIKDISNIGVGDMVLDKEGKYRKVLNTMERKSDCIFEIKSSCRLPILATENHPVLTRDGWKEVNSLKKGDYVGTPILKDLMEYNISEELAELIGLFCADGWKDKGKTKNRVSFALNRDKDEEYIKHLMKIIKNKFNVKVSRRDRKKDKSTYVSFFSKNNFIFEEAGNSAKTKHIPQFILRNKNLNILKSFLIGYWRGDGCFVKDKKGSFISFTTISSRLAVELQLAFCRFGIIPNINYDKNERQHEINGRKLKNINARYIIRSYDIIAHNLFGVKKIGRRTTKHYLDEDGVIWTKIKYIKKLKKSIKVYNFEVEVSNSYIANNIITHNCELISPSANDWSIWAGKNNIDSRIISFVNFKPSSMNDVNFDNNQKFTTTRGWERVSCLIKGEKLGSRFELICCSAIGEGIAREFIAFCKIQEKLNLEDIIKHPNKIKNITDISTKYFLVCAFAEKYKDNKIKFDIIMKASKVLDEIDNSEFVALLWRLGSNYSEKFRKDFLEDKGNEKFIEKYGRYLI